MTTATVERVHEDPDLVRLYLTDIGKHPLLTKDDEARLAQAIEAGEAARAQLNDGGKITPTERRKLRRTVRDGDDARRQFIQCNLRLVVSIAKRYQHSGLPLLDLVQEGNLGLMHAVEKFDWRKGFKFSTYATWWIRQAIDRGIANTGRTIRLPVHAGDNLALVRKARAAIEMRTGRRATTEEIALEINLPVERVYEVLRYVEDPVSLDEHIGPEQDVERIERVADRSAVDPLDAAITATLPEHVERMLSVLDERERTIVLMRFGLDGGEERTLEEVGKHFGLTRERIRQLEARLMSKLRHPSSDIGARELLAS